MPAFALLVRDPVAVAPLCACRPSLAKPTVGLSEVLWLCRKFCLLYSPFFDSPNFFSSRKDHEKAEFEVHEVYAVDVLVSSGEGKVSPVLFALPFLCARGQSGRVSEESAAASGANSHILVGASSSQGILVAWVSLCLFGWNFFHPKS